MVSSFASIKPSFAAKERYFRIEESFLLIVLGAD
jgi:hypothetical protein